MKLFGKFETKIRKMTALAAAIGMIANPMSAFADRQPATAVSGVLAELRGELRSADNGVSRAELRVAVPGELTLTELSPKAVNSEADVTVSGLAKAALDTLAKNPAFDQRAKIALVNSLAYDRVVSLHPEGFTPEQNENVVPVMHSILEGELDLHEALYVLTQAWKAELGDVRAPVLLDIAAMSGRVRPAERLSEGRPELRNEENRPELRQTYFLPEVTGKENEAELNRILWKEIEEAEIIPGASAVSPKLGPQGWRGGINELIITEVESGVKGYLEEQVRLQKFETFPDRVYQGVISSVAEWLGDPSIDRYTKRGILKAIAQKRWKDITTAHSDPVKFGTAGVRGPAALTLTELEDLDDNGFRAEILKGPGTVNNVALAKVTTGVARYHRSIGKTKVSITYDSRVYGKALADFVAAIFLKEGLQVFLFDESAPMPEMAYSVAALKLDLGILISASHNPPKSQGYKVSNSLGAQMDPVSRAGVMDFIFGRKANVAKKLEAISAVSFADVEWIIRASSNLDDPMEVYKLQPGDPGPLVRMVMSQEKLPADRLVILGESDIAQDEAGRQHMDVHNRHADHVAAHILRPSVVRVEAASMRRVRSSMYGNGEYADRRIARDRLGFVNTTTVNEYDFFQGGQPGSRKSLFRNLTNRQVDGLADPVIPDPGNSAGHALAWELVAQDYLEQVREAQGIAGAATDNDAVVVAGLTGLRAMDATDPDADRLGVNVTIPESELPPQLAELDALPPLSTKTIGKLSAVSAAARALIVPRVAQLIFYLVPRALRERVGFAALKLLSANDTWSILVKYRIDRLLEMTRGKTVDGQALPADIQRVPAGLKYTIVKTHVTTDSLIRVAEYAKSEGLDVEVKEPYVGFTLVAELIQQGWEEGKINLAGAEESGGFSFGGAPPAFYTLMHLFQKYDGLRVQIDAEGNIISNHADPLLSLDRDSYFGYSSEELRQTLGFLKNSGILEERDGQYNLTAQYAGVRGDHEAYWGARISGERTLREWASFSPGDRLGKRGHTLEKDGLLAGVLMLEVAAYAKSKGKTLNEFIREDLYMNPNIGYFATTNQALEFEDSLAGKADKIKVLQNVLGLARRIKGGEEVRINGKKITKVKIFIPKTQKYADADNFPLDNYRDLIDLISGDGEQFLKADPSKILSFFPEEGVRFYFDDSENDHLTIRPSGTENKIRFYVQIFGGLIQKSVELIQAMSAADFSAVNIALEAQDVAKAGLVRSELRAWTPGTTEELGNAVVNAWDFAFKEKQNGVIAKELFDRHVAELNRLLDFDVNQGAAVRQRLTDLLNDPATLQRKYDAGLTVEVRGLADQLVLRSELRNEFAAPYEDLEEGYRAELRAFPAEIPVSLNAPLVQLDANNFVKVTGIEREKTGFLARVTISSVSNESAVADGAPVKQVVVRSGGVLAGYNGSNFTVVTINPSPATVTLRRAELRSGDALDEEFRVADEVEIATARLQLDQPLQIRVSNQPVMLTPSVSAPGIVSFSLNSPVGVRVFPGVVHRTINAADQGAIQTGVISPAPLQNLTPGSKVTLIFETGYAIITVQKITAAGLVLPFLATDQLKVTWPGRPELRLTAPAVPAVTADQPIPNREALLVIEESPELTPLALWNYVALASVRTPVPGAADQFTVKGVNETFRVNLTVDRSLPAQPVVSRIQVVRNGTVNKTFDFPQTPETVLVFGNIFHYLNTRSVRPELRFQSLDTVTANITRAVSVLGFIDSDAGLDQVARLQQYVPVIRAAQIDGRTAQLLPTLAQGDGLLSLLQETNRLLRREQEDAIARGIQPPFGAGSKAPILRGAAIANLEAAQTQLEALLAEAPEAEARPELRLAGADAFTMPSSIDRSAAFRGQGVISSGPADAILLDEATALEGLPAIDLTFRAESRSIPLGVVAGSDKTAQIVAEYNRRAELRGAAAVFIANDIDALIDQLTAMALKSGRVQGSRTVKVLALVSPESNLAETLKLKLVDFKIVTRQMLNRLVESAGLTALLKKYQSWVRILRSA